MFFQESGTFLLIKKIYCTHLFAVRSVMSGVHAAEMAVLPAVSGENEESGALLQTYKFRNMPDPRKMTVMKLIRKNIESVYAVP